MAVLDSLGFEFFHGDHFVFVRDDGVAPKHGGCFPTTDLHHDRFGDATVWRAISCGGTPAQSSCMVTPSSLQMNGTSPTTATVTVTTIGKGFVLPFWPDAPDRMYHRPAPLTFALLGTFAIVVGLLRWRREQRLWCAPVFTLAVLVCLVMTLTSCGGASGGSGGGTGTQAGTYTISVSGSFTSGSTTLTHTAKLALVVQ